MRVSPRKAVIYCRVSSTKQKAEGSGLKSQEFRCRQYAQAKGYTVEAVFRDDYTGGGDFMNRPAMAELLGHLDREVDPVVVVFDDLKRLARDTVYHHLLRQELSRRGATPDCLNFRFEETPEGRFVETILAAQGELERKQNRRQVIQKMKARLEAGFWCFGPPKGYRMVKSNAGRVLEPVEPVASVVQEALTRFADGALKAKADVVDYLAQHQGKLGVARADFDMVNRILGNPLYAGIVEYPRWGVPPRPGHHRPLISQERHEAIMRKLQNPQPTRISATDRPEFPLRQLVTCGVCERRMTAGTCRGKKRYYSFYTCNRKACTARPKNIRKAVLEADYVRLLSSLSFRVQSVERIRRLALGAWERLTADANSRQKDAARQIRERQIAIRSYVDLLGSAPRSLQARYEEKILELESEISGLQRGESEWEERNFPDALEHVLEFVQHPHVSWEKADLKGKRAIHALVFQGTLPYAAPAGFRTPSLTPVFQLKKDLREAEVLSGGPDRS